MNRAGAPHPITPQIRMINRRAEMNRRRATEAEALVMPSPYALIFLVAADDAASLRHIGQAVSHNCSKKQTTATALAPAGTAKTKKAPWIRPPRGTVEAVKAIKVRRRRRVGQRARHHRKHRKIRRAPDGSWRRMTWMML